MFHSGVQTRKEWSSTGRGVTVELYVGVERPNQINKEIYTVTVPMNYLVDVFVISK